MPRPQRYKLVVKELQSRGWVLLRQGKGSHELWGLPDGSVYESIPRHREVSAGIVGQLVKKLPDPPKEWK